MLWLCIGGWVVFGLGLGALLGKIAQGLFGH